MFLLSVMSAEWYEDAKWLTNSGFILFLWQNKFKLKQIPSKGVWQRIWPILFSSTINI